MIETNGAAANTYNLLITLGSSSKCVYACKFTPPIPQIDIGSNTPNAPKNNQVFSYYRFNGLKLSEIYTYQCTSAKFTSNPLTITYPHSNTKTKLLAFGDWADNNLNKPELDKGAFGPVTLKYLQTRPDGDDAILFPGDLAYNLHNIQGGSKDAGKNGDIWLNKIMAVTSKIPFQFIMGNHEAMERKPHNNYFQRFYFPDQVTSKGQWYSFDINNVHIMTINSNIIATQYSKEDFSGLKTEMEKWLKNDIAKSTKQWKILYLHSPLYCSKDSNKDTNDNRCGKTAEIVRNILEPIISGKVDLVIGAHLHSYERTTPALSGKEVLDGVKGDVYTDPKAPVSALCGNAGNNEGLSTKKYALNKYSRNVSVNPGVCEIVVIDNTLTFNMIAGSRTSMSAAFTVQDTFQIVKKKVKVENKLKK